MAREIERKFLVRNAGWREQADGGVQLTQFYVATADERSVRVRIRNGEGALLTLKFGGAGLVRDEFEYEIPVEDAREMERFAIGRVIGKTRYRVPHLGRIYEVDVFAGALEGLVIAELETPELAAGVELPAWIGREVTDDAAFYNSSLAINGLPEER